jgi:hypothetical protein
MTDWGHPVHVVVYYLMNLGAFGVLMMVLNDSGREDLEGFRGLAWRGGALPAAAMAVFLFSLAGIPPFAGFIGKFYLFAAVIDRHMWTLAVVAGLNSVVALYYYARIVRDVPRQPDRNRSGRSSTVTVFLVGVLMLGTLVFGVWRRSSTSPSVRCCRRPLTSRLQLARRSWRPGPSRRCRLRAGNASTLPLGLRRSAHVTAAPPMRTMRRSPNGVPIPLLTMSATASRRLGSAHAPDPPNPKCP